MKNIFKNPVVVVLLSVCFFVSAKTYAVNNPRERPVSYSMNSGRTGVLFDFGIYYGQSEATADPALGNEWKNLTSIYDIKLGYIFDSNFYLGGEYSTRNDSMITTSNQGGTAAAGLGIFWGTGFHARAFYRINENFGSYTDGSGFQADLGYMTNLSSNFYVGVLLSHRQVTYKSNSSIVGFNSYTKKDTQPMLTLGFLIN